jgi:hypothetical protein
VGITHASAQIQLDRYSAISTAGATIDFLDSTNTMKGWKTILTKTNAWVRYDSVNFTDRKWKSAAMNAFSTEGGSVQIRLNSVDGPLIAQVKVPKGKAWVVTKTSLSRLNAGTYDLFILSTGDAPVEIDWVSFE